MTPEYAEQRGYTDAFFGKDYSDIVPKEFLSFYLKGQERFLTSFLEEVFNDTENN